MITLLEADSAVRNFPPSYVYRSTEADRRNWGLAAQREIANDRSFGLQTRLPRERVAGGKAWYAPLATPPTEQLPFPAWGFVFEAIPVSGFIYGANELAKGVKNKDPRRRVRGINAMSLSATLACLPGIAHQIISTETAPVAITAEAPQFFAVDSDTAIQRLDAWVPELGETGFVPMDLPDKNGFPDPNGKADGAMLYVIPDDVVLRDQTRFKKPDGAPLIPDGRARIGFIEGVRQGMPVVEDFLVFNNGKETTAYRLIYTNQGVATGVDLVGTNGEKFGTLYYNLDHKDTSSPFATLILKEQIDLSNGVHASILLDLYTNTPGGYVENIAYKASANPVAVVTQESTKTPIPTSTPTPEATQTPEVGYPIFDQAEDVLTPEILPKVSMKEDVKTGNLVETVLRMYSEGKIRQISPDAKPYPFQWGNKTLDKYGMGQPMSMFMTQEEKFFFEQNPPHTIALFQSEEQNGEKVVVVVTIWKNKDGTYSGMPQTIPFSWNIQFPGNPLNYLKSSAPVPFAYKTQQDCLNVKGNSQEYCDYHMSVQEEWLKLVQTWVETGNMPPGLSHIPLHMMGGTTIYITE